MEKRWKKGLPKSMYEQADMWCSLQVFLCFQLLNLKYLQNILYIGHYSHNFCLSLSKTILNYKFESLSSWLFIFWTRFALKCQRKINSWKKGFSSGTQSQLIKFESLKSVPKGAVIKAFSSAHSPSDYYTTAFLILLFWLGKISQIWAGLAW